MERAEYIGTQLDPFIAEEVKDENLGENEVEEATVERRVEEETALELHQKPEFPNGKIF